MKNIDVKEHIFSWYQFQTIPISEPKRKKFDKTWLCPTVKKMVQFIKADIKSFS